MSVLRPGSKLGRFEISGVLGQGAMGVVYLAHDPSIDRPLAIKTIRSEAARDDNAAEIEARFLKEARLAGRLQHANIVTVYDVGREGDLYFIAMEYVEGRPLTHYLAAPDDLPLSVRVDIIRQAAEALGHAHERGVVHRDMKPGNILVSKDGRVKVTDFGIGKFLGAEPSDLTRTGQMIGSPAYMSPEQVRGDKIDGRSDLFSLGVVLYELLTGKRPFPGESITTLVYQILHTEPKNPRDIKASLPVSTREVMLRLLAKQPDRRPATANEFIQELERIEKFQRESELTRRADIAAPPPPPPSGPSASAAATTPGPAAPPPRHSRVGLAGVVLAIAVVAVAAVFLLRERKTAIPAPPVSVAAAPTEGPTAAAAPAETPLPETTAIVLPTPGPEAAVDATVGASRLADTPRPRPTARPRPSPTAAETKVAAAPPPPPAAPARPERIDAAYETRGSVRFTSSPDQARLYLDGRYVGIADDWDNRGGGRALELGKAGTHYVRMELPGYRTKTFQIDVVADARDSVSIDEELDRYDRAPYEKLPAVYDRTTSEVEFSVEPPDAGVSEEGRALGQASAFGPASPLKLSGPAVHDLMLSAPGHKPKLVRILVAANAGKDRAKVAEKLKPQ